MTPPFGSLTERIGGRGAEGWAVHGAARRAEADGEDVILLSVGDPDHDTPSGVVDAAVRALRAGDTHYAPIAGRRSFRTAVADHLGATTGLERSPDEVIAAVGTQGALFATCACLLDAGDEVLAFDPTYLTYEASVGASGATLVGIPPAPGFRPDVDRMIELVGPRTKALLVNSPANPTGVVFTPEEAHRLAEAAVASDLWVISDEVYAELVFEGVHTHLAGLDAMRDRTVTIGSVSKSHAMTGWRAGWAVAPPALIEHLDRFSLAATYGLPGFIQEAATVALRDHADDVSRMRADYHRRRDLTVEMLRGSGLDVVIPDAGMFVLADVRAVNRSSAVFAWDLFRATGVSVLDAGAFGRSAEGWVRISFTISDDRLREGLTRLTDFCLT